MSPRLPCDQVPVRTVFTVVEAGETKSLFADTLETSLQVKAKYYTAQAFFYNPHPSTNLTLFFPDYCRV